MAMPRYIGLPCSRVPTEPSGEAWAIIMWTSTRRLSGTKTFSTLTLLEPDARMPMNRSSPQSGRMLTCSLGITMKTNRGGPAEVGARLPAMKWVETGMPEANGQTPETR